MASNLDHPEIKIKLLYNNLELDLDITQNQPSSVSHRVYHLVPASASRFLALKTDPEPRELLINVERQAHPASSREALMFEPTLNGQKCHPLRMPPGSLKKVFTLKEVIEEKAPENGNESDEGQLKQLSLPKRSKHGKLELRVYREVPKPVPTEEASEAKLSKSVSAEVNLMAHYNGELPIYSGDTLPSLSPTPIPTPDIASLIPWRSYTIHLSLPPTSPALPINQADHPGPIPNRPFSGYKSQPKSATRTPIRDRRASPSSLIPAISTMQPPPDHTVGMSGRPGSTAIPQSGRVPLRLSQAMSVQRLDHHMTGERSSPHTSMLPQTANTDLTTLASANALGSISSNGATKHPSLAPPFAGAKYPATLDFTQPPLPTVMLRPETSSVNDDSPHQAGHDPLSLDSRIEPSLKHPLESTNESMASPSTTAPLSRMTGPSPTHAMGDPIGLTNPPLPIEHEVPFETLDLDVDMSNQPDNEFGDIVGMLDSLADEHATRIEHAKAIGATSSARAAPSSTPDQESSALGTVTLDIDTLLLATDNTVPTRMSSSPAITHIKSDPAAVEEALDDIILYDSPAASPIIEVSSPASRPPDKHTRPPGRALAPISQIPIPGFGTHPLPVVPTLVSTYRPSKSRPLDEPVPRPSDQAPAAPRPGFRHLPDPPSDIDIRPIPTPIRRGPPNTEDRQYRPHSRKNEAKRPHWDAVRSQEARSSPPAGAPSSSNTTLEGALPLPVIPSTNEEPLRKRPRPAEVIPMWTKPQAIFNPTGDELRRIRRESRKRREEPQMRRGRNDGRSVGISGHAGSGRRKEKRYNPDGSLSRTVGQEGIDERRQRRRAGEE